MKLTLLLCLVASLVSAAPAGTVPVGAPNRLTIGLFEGDNNTWMKNTGIKWDVRYRYLAGFDQSTVNWANGYNASNLRNGSFATAHMTQSDSQGFVPAFSLYAFYGLPTGWEGQTYLKMQSPTTTLQFFQDFKLLMQRAKDFGKPVYVLIEPDLIAFAQQYSNNNPNAVAAVASTGMPELQGLPNTIAGFQLAFLAIKKATGATNAILGLHISGWATGVDLFHSPAGWSASLPLAVDKVYNFLAPGGLLPNVTGLTYDVLVGDPLDRDYDFYRLTRGDPNRKWDMSDTAAIGTGSFNRYAEWLRLWNRKANKRWVLWQIPAGNAQSRNVCQNGTQGSGYVDNRPEYFFGANGDAHRRKFVEAGVISMMFGAGDGCGSTQQTDNNYLRNNVAAFYDAGGLPFGDAGTPVVDAGVKLDGGTDAGTVGVCPAGYQCVCQLIPVDAGVVDAGTVDAGKPDSGVPDAGQPVVDAGSVLAYSFETGTEGFVGTGVALTTVTQPVFSGSKALALNLSNTAAGTFSIQLANPPVKPNSQIVFRVYVPSGTSLLSIQPYAQETAATSWKWVALWVPVAQVVTNSWNTFTLPIAANAGVYQSLGLEFSFSGAYSGQIYVDYITLSGASVAVDAGTPVVDAGVVIRDAGVPTPIVDAGTVAGTFKLQMIGDSLTEAWPYRCSLYDLLVSGGARPVFVGSVNDQYGCTGAKGHDGHGGWTTSNLADKLATWLPTYNPDIITLMSGTNDVAWWTAESGAQVAERQNTYIGRIFTLLPTVKIVVMTIPTQSSSVIAPNNVNRQVLVADYNARLKVLVAARKAAGQKIVLVDMNAVLVLSDLRDGIHPNDTAQVSKMGPAAYQGVVQLLQ